MPFINVNVQTVKEVSHEIEGLDESLINNYFKQMTDRINDLISNANGIKSADIKSTLSTVSSEVETLQNDIKNNLSGLETDIAEVLKNYEVNTEAALEKLVALFNVMQGFSENGTFNFTSSDAIDYMEEKGANDSPDTIEEPVEDDRVWYQRAWDSLKGNYVQNEQEFFGFFSGENVSDIYKETTSSDNILTGILNAVGDTAELIFGAGVSFIDFGLSTVVDTGIGLVNFVGEAVSDASDFVIGLLNS